MDVLKNRSGEHIVTARIMSMKNYSNTIGNRTPNFRLVVQCLNQLRHRVHPLGGGMNHKNLSR
jgi:hypothetical protein